MQVIHQLLMKLETPKNQSHLNNLLHLEAQLIKHLFETLNAANNKKLLENVKAKTVHQWSLHFRRVNKSRWQKHHKDQLVKGSVKIGIRRLNLIV